jgi:hypothetical protein
MVSEVGGREEKRGSCIPEGVVFAAGGIGEVDLAVASLEVVDDVDVVGLAGGNGLEEVAGEVKDAEARALLGLGGCDDARLAAVGGRDPDGRVIAVAAVGVCLCHGLDHHKGAMQAAPAGVAFTLVRPDALAVAGTVVFAGVQIAGPALPAREARALDSPPVLPAVAIVGTGAADRRRVVELNAGVIVGVDIQAQSLNSPLEGADTKASDVVRLDSVGENAAGVSRRRALIDAESLDLDVFMTREFKVADEIERRAVNSHCILHCHK